MPREKRVAKHRQFIGCGAQNFASRTMLALMGVTAISACATSEVEAEARQVAKCMVEALESTNRVEAGFDRSKSSADPVLNVEEIWRMKCHVEAILVVE
jgi:hypothetical protein